MTNILIGIGGTGAKVVESALTLFTAGIGPDHVHLGMIDQDRANGNVNRTQTRIKNLRRLQRVWGGKSDSQLDWTRGKDRVDFAGVRIDELFADRALWCPQGDDLSLSHIIGRDLSPQQRDLFDLLFMPGEHEQDLQLGEGYRGRAHVGAAALTAAMLDDENELIDKMRELMQSGGSEEIRIFLVGSAFGGTGAAGFPTLARELHRIRNEPEFRNKETVTIGGALMLPYFAFSPPEEEGQPVVTTDELIPKARLALEYYGRLFETEQTFDRFFILGWSPFFHLGYHQAGNYEQRNPPLVPELIAATAAIEFFGRPAPAEPGDDVPVMLSARAGDGVRWSDFLLPQVEERLGQLMRFSAYWRYLTEPLLQARSLFGAGNWTQQLRGKMKPLDHEEELGALRSVTQDVLEWAAAMQKMSRDRWAPGPWDTGGFLERLHEPTAIEPVALREAPVDGAEAAFDALVRTETGEAHERGSSAIYEDLVKNGETLSRGSNRGYGKVAAAAWRAAALHPEKVS